MRLFNAPRPSWLGRAMEPVLNSGLLAFPMRRAEAARNSMSPRACSIFETLAFRFSVLSRQEANSWKGFLGTIALRQ